MTKSAENIEKKIEAQLEKAETVKSPKTGYRSKRKNQAKGTGQKR